MSSPPVEMIILNQVASYLAMPIFVVDAAGTLVYYNEPAEALLGRRYEETADMPFDVWGTAFAPTAANGTPLDADDLPLAVAVRGNAPVSGSFWIRGLDGVRRGLVVTAVPLTDRDGAVIGAAAIFWEA